MLLLVSLLAFPSPGILYKGIETVRVRPDRRAGPPMDSLEEVSARCSEPNRKGGFPGNSRSSMMMTSPSPRLTSDGCAKRESSSLAEGSTGSSVRASLAGPSSSKKTGSNWPVPKKPSSLFRSFTVTNNGKEYGLRAASPVERMFILSENGRELGTVRPEHAFTRKAVIDLPAEIDLPVRIFMVWLVLVLWKRDEESAS